MLLTRHLWLALTTALSLNNNNNNNNNETMSAAASTTGSLAKAVTVKIVSDVV